MAADTLIGQKTEEARKAATLAVEANVTYTEKLSVAQGAKDAAHAAFITAEAAQEQVVIAAIAAADAERESARAATSAADAYAAVYSP